MCGLFVQIIHPFYRDSPCCTPFRGPDFGGRLSWPLFSRLRRPRSRTTPWETAKLAPWIRCSMMMTMLAQEHDFSHYQSLLSYSYESLFVHHYSSPFFTIHHCSSPIMHHYPSLFIMSHHHQSLWSKTVWAIGDHGQPYPVNDVRPKTGHHFAISMIMGTDSRGSHYSKLGFKWMWQTKMWIWSRICPLTPLTPAGLVISLFK